MSANMILSVGVMFWVAVAVVVLAIGVLIALVPMKLYVRAWMSGAHISMSKLVGMRFRKCDVKGIVAPEVDLGISDAKRQKEDPGVGTVK